MKATLIRSVEESANITSFYFRPERSLRFIAGQFVELTLQHDNPDSRGIKRWFTISSSPTKDYFAITTYHSNPSSSFKNAVWALQTGDSIDVSEPMGDFVLPKDPKQPLVFVAGGIGITPFHSIVEWLVDTGQNRQIQMLYATHSVDDRIFANLFTQPWIQTKALTAKARLTARQIVSEVGGIEGKQLFISGPEAMTEDIVLQFKNDFGLQQHQIITDYFPGYAD